MKEDLFENILIKVNESWYCRWCPIFVYCYLQNYSDNDSNDEKRSRRKELDDHTSIFDSTCLREFYFFCGPD